jgi:hypothetical protein
MEFDSLLGGPYGESQKLKIEFDSLLGGPYSENSRTFVDEILIRKKAPLIGVQSWKDVKDTVKIAIAEDMLVSQLFSLANCYGFSTSSLLFYLSFHSNRKFGN